MLLTWSQTNDLITAVAHMNVDLAPLWTIQTFLKSLEDKKIVSGSILIA